MKIKNFLLIICILILSKNVFATDLITHYQRTWIPCYKNNELRIAIRMYERNTIPYYLVVNPYNFETEAAPVNGFTLRKMITMGSAPGYYTWKEISETPYGVALLKDYSLNLISPLQEDLRNKFSPGYFVNYGVIHANSVLVDGYFLTVDMCPSSKPYERDFFLALVNRAKNEGPIPVALSMTGAWLLGHGQEFNELLQWEKSNKLHITWINHSYSHVYYDDFKDESTLGKNFLLFMLTNVKSEFLTTERLLLENGELPSVFFRYPGLISDDKLNAKLREYGLIPLGSDAWLNKGQIAKPGSIILVHGNSNEHPGIEKVMPIIQQTGNHLLPLNQLFS
jgi:hypothetical protein